MPFYDYKCRSCRKDFEIKRGMNETGEVRCPICHKPAQRVFNVPRSMHGENAGSCSDCSSGVCSTCPSK